MKMQFWGVRGSVPTPGAEYLRYGGNTCCLAIYGDHDELIVLDTGTGFCQLGDMLMDSAFARGRGVMTLLISHTYWDHILGLPFPSLVHIPGNRLQIYGPDSTRGSLEFIYDGILSPVYSPVFGLAHIGATHSFQPISTKPFQVGGIRISALPLSQHKHSPIWAYRVEEQNRSLVYITDVRYTDDQMWQQAVDFARGASVLVHSAPYTREEQAHDYGHSRVEDAIDIAHEAGVERLFIFHHAPTRSDNRLDELVAHYRGELHEQEIQLHFDAAKEGHVEDV